MPRLTVIDGVDQNMRFEFVDAVVAIGRDSTSTVRLNDVEVSRRHAELRTRGDGQGYTLHDLGSANGVYLNGRLVDNAQLRSGDQIRVGKTTFVFSGMPGEAPVAATDQPLRVVTRPGDDLPSAIIQSIDADEGSQRLLQPDQTASPELTARLADLGVMYEAIQTVRGTLDIDQMLEKILALLFRAVDADRGCALLRSSADDPLTPRAVRWREGRGPRDEIALSRTIIDHVVRENQGLIVTDAGRDDRFRGGASVIRIGIREAICVPLTGRRDTVGILYFDTLRSGTETADDSTPRFSNDQLTLAIAVAHQTALAIEETRNYRAMVQAERLAAVGQAIASLSHHIKNILQGMQSAADVLKLGIADRDDASIQTGWRLIEKNQTRIYDLVLDMLSYSKEREPAYEPCSAEKIVDEVLELAKGRAASFRVALRREAEALPEIQLDPEAIHRAMLNLVTNAIDAVAETEKPEIVVRLAREPDGKWLRISVSDNGCGIEPERLSSLFKPFLSTKGSRGTGLGLAVSRKIAREHGGDLTVSSQLGTGSEFTLRLPIRDPS